MYIDSSIKKIIQDTLDQLYTEEVPKPCRLVFPASAVSCSNCVTDLITGKPSVRWRSGGPIPFPQGSICSLCNGTGKRFDERTRDVVMVVESNPAKFYMPFPNVDIKTNSGMIQTKFFIDLLPDVLQCDHMIVETQIEGMVRLKYKLHGEPLDYHKIVQGRYITALWTRTG